MKYLAPILILFSLQTVAGEFKSPDQIRKEFKEPGHIPQGVPAVKYQKLEKVIPQVEQEKIRKKKSKKRQEKRKKASLIQQEKKGPLASLFSFLIPSANAACRTKPDNIEPAPAPIPAPSPTDKPTPIPTVSPIPVPSIVPTPIVTPIPSPIPSISPTPMPSPDVIEALDMRNYDSSIRNQWDSTCTAHGLIEGLENLNNRNGKKGNLSARYLWSLYQQYNAYLAINSAAKFKQIDEKLWPQASATPSAQLATLSSQGLVKLSNFELLNDEIPAVLDALRQHFPVYVAMAVPADMAACRATIRYTTAITTGGHALLVVGFVMDKSVEGGGYFIIKNSWGVNCHDKGYMYFPIALCDKPEMYCTFWALKGIS